jgi:hypothetical protein
VRRAATTLLEAYTRSVLDGEDRLTELFATLLQHDRHTAFNVAAAAGLDVEAVTGLTVEVSTQESFVFGRLDLEVMLRAPDGTIWGRLWFENKLWARFQPQQLERYGDALRKRPGRGRLCVLAPTSYEVRVPTAEERARFGGWTAMTWPQIAEIVAADGIEALARRPLDKRTAIEQLRWELVQDLRRRGLALMDPVGHLDIITVGREARTREVLTELWNRAVQAVVDPGQYRGTDEWDGGGFSWSQTFATVGKTAAGADLSDDWLGAHDGWLELLLSSEDFWAEDRTGEPAFGIGAVFEHKKGKTIRDELADPARAEWRAQLREAGFSVLATSSDSYVRVYRTRYLADLLTAGASLDQQARALAAWVTSGLNDLLGYPPRPAWTSSVRANSI